MARAGKSAVGALPPAGRRGSRPAALSPSVPGRAGSQEAVDAARAMQSRIDGARHREPGGGRLTFIELLVEHYLPLQVDLSR